MDLLLDGLLALLVCELLLAVLEALLLPLFLALLVTLVLVFPERILADRLVGFGVQLLQAFGLDVIVNVAGELALVALLVIVGQRLHVLGHVAAEDVFTQSLGVEFLGFHIVARETLFGVRDVNAAVGSALQSSEDAGTGAGSRQADIEKALEGAAALAVHFGILGELKLSIGLLDTFEHLGEIKFAESAASNEKTHAVGGSPVGQTVLDAIALELVGVGRDEDFVAGELGRHDLADDVAVGEAHDQAVFGRVVLVLGLGDQTLAGVVVGLAGSAALVFDLVAAADGCEKKVILRIEEF